MHRRLNITLPEETLQLLDRVAPKGDRSRFIAEAVSFFVQAKGRAHLRKRLREGANRRADRDRQIAAEWFTLDEEAGQQRTWPDRFRACLGAWSGGIPRPKQQQLRDLRDPFA